MKFILYSSILLLLFLSIEVNGVEKKLRASLRKHHPGRSVHRLSSTGHRAQSTSESSSQDSLTLEGKSNKGIFDSLQKGINVAQSGLNKAKETTQNIAQGVTDIKNTVKAGAAQVGNAVVNTASAIGGAISNGVQQARQGVGNAIVGVGNIILGKDGKPVSTPPVNNPPVTPVAPVQPVTPAKPVTPVTPVAPAKPVTPVAPVKPVAPVTPVAPAKPVTPVAPAKPVTPVAPAKPQTPVAPVKPTLPVPNPTPAVLQPKPNPVPAANKTTGFMDILKDKGTQTECVPKPKQEGGIRPEVMKDPTADTKIFSEGYSAKIFEVFDLFLKNLFIADIKDAWSSFNKEEKLAHGDQSYEYAKNAAPSPPNLLSEKKIIIGYSKNLWKSEIQIDRIGAQKIDVFDLEDKGFLNFKEFCYMTVKQFTEDYSDVNCKHCLYSTRMEIQNFFDYSDCHKSGFVSSENVYIALKNLKHQIPIDSEVTNDFILKCDIKGQGWLSKKDFTYGILRGYYERYCGKDGVTA